MIPHKNQLGNSKLSAYNNGKRLVGNRMDSSRDNGKPSDIDPFLVDNFGNKKRSIAKDDIKRMSGSYNSYMRSSKRPISKYNRSKDRLISVPTLFSN